MEEAKKNKLLKSDKHYDFMESLGEATTNKSGKDIDDDFW